MAMSYTTLIGSKSLSGSIASWTGYAKLEGQADLILTEAQSLLFQQLRVREMRKQWVFGMPVGNAMVALPSDFLDPIGRLRDQNNQGYGHKTESDITNARQFQPASGTFGTNPFTTGAAGSSIVTVVELNHGLTQCSDITIAGAAVVDGIDVNTTSQIVNVVDADTFQIDVEGAEAVAGSVTGGGAVSTYTANQLVASSPIRWTIFDEMLQFDCAFVQALQFRLLCFRSPKLLSASNQTNFLTARYPLLLRKACQTAAADWMQDTEEYTKSLQALTGLIQATNAESDLIYRGADLDTETP